ncbi:SseA [Desulfamplus magnetovallimortis]|uniref:SseA n=1 Tax=Desulfamplus magnetovallimortis TaxID=1246637 RepID=A0A1W1H5P4_9BACT|nr:rhodanese-like domain-containing protein [Desulfamplus magnetovallimortis]SLM27705.1 SseA [Desulfamplus magnetovallimortis]
MINFRFVKYLIFIVLSIVLIASCNDSDVTEKNPSEPLTPVEVKGYPNGQFIATSEDLSESGVVIVDARGETAYNEEHIPGAVNIMWQEFVDGSTNLLPVDQLEEVLGQKGLTRESKIIIYDDTTASWGASGRLFWMFETLGCEWVKILDGGWDKWIADENNTESRGNTLNPATFKAVVKTDKTSDKAHIKSRLNDSDFVVVDTRTDEEFNGWQLYGEARGGHITGAVQLPYAWYFKSDKTVLDYQDMKSLFESKGVTEDKEVVPYCTVGIRSAYAYYLTRLMGYERSSNYDASITDWADSDESFYPMEKLANYQKLVYPKWVNQLIEYHKEGSLSSPPPDYPYSRDHKYIIFETQWGTIEYATSYKSGHIPGSIHSNSDIYENDYPRWFLLDDNDVHQAMGNMGITEDTTVIVYSDSNIFAARLWWILMYAGVKDVRYLNGGYQQWIAGGYQGEETVNQPTPVMFTGSVRPEYIATVDDVFYSYTDTSNVFLADVRSYEEYIGEISGYSYVAQKGRIPNSVWCHDADDSGGIYVDSDGTIRSYTEIMKLWNGFGIHSQTTPVPYDSSSANLLGGGGMLEKELIFYCGSGYRSALTFMYAHLMGYENVRNFSDGWEGWSTEYRQDDNCTDSITPGWCQDPSGRPIESGDES